MFNRLLAFILFIIVSAISICIIEHRKFYSRLRHFDYNSRCIGQIAIIPSETILMKLKNDYDEMAKKMMYDDVPTFAEVVNTLKIIQDAFNQKS